MKRFFAAVPAAALLLLSCPQALVRNPYQDLAGGNFWAQNLGTKEFYTVDAVLLAEGEKCAVWTERSAGVSVSAGEAIARKYDTVIYPVIVETFGSDAVMESGDIDKNGKLTLLLLDIQDDFDGSGAYTAGYFYSNDLFESKPKSLSNEQDMIYVDTNPSKVLSEDSYATIAHELQHFINYVTRSSADKRAMDHWVDEGLSAAAEQLYLNRQNEERISHFVFSETVQQGNNFFVWGNGSGNSILDDYSTVYLFFQWLRIQSGGTDLYREIINSQYYDYRAVTGAISGDFAAALGSTDWETILRSWLAANYINSPAGLYGYHGELSQLRVWALGGQARSLRPGEGVYSVAGDPPGDLPSGDSRNPNIKYAGLPDKASGSPPEEPSVSLRSLYPKGRLLTFNSNSNNSAIKNGGSEMGRLTGGEAETIPQPSSTAGGRSAGQAGDAWRIDARDILGREDHGGR